MKIRRYAAWIIGGLASGVVLVVAVGAALPVTHRAVGRAVLPAPPPEVYALISDVERLPSWRSDVTRVEIVASDQSRLMFREIGSDGAILYSVDEAVPHSRWVTRIADPELPFGGRWVFTLREAERGTELEIAEEGEVYNPVFRFVSRFVMGHTAGIERYLADLSRQLGAENPARRE